MKVIKVTTHTQMNNAQGDLWGIIGQIPCVFKSIRLHVSDPRGFFVKLVHIP